MLLTVYTRILYSEAAVAEQSHHLQGPTAMADLERLTKRQREVYEFIRDKIRNRGYGPTVREIGSHFEISSPNGVMCHLKALEKKGLITREPNMSRAIHAGDRNARRGRRLAAGRADRGRPAARGGRAGRADRFRRRCSAPTISSCWKYAAIR